MPIKTESGEVLQTEGEHHTARCKVCDSRINVPLDPFCCVVCLNSDIGEKHRAMESAFLTEAIKHREAMLKKTLKRKKIR